MRVATIICNYNYGEYIEDAILSALNQSYPTTVCVFDDASTDNSLEVISKYKENIVFAQSPNKVGPSYARNTLIELGINDFDYFAILDADDIMYPNKIEKCMELITSDPTIGVVYADYDILNVQTGNLIREYKQPFDRIVLGSECIVHSGALISKQALKDVQNQMGYYNNSMRTCEDYELWVRISKKYMIAHLAESLTLVRNHNQNSTNTVDKAIWEENWRKVAEAYA